MPSIPLKSPDGLGAYIGPDTTAHLTVFFNTPAKANEYLVVVFGTNTFGGVGELAHLQMPEEVFAALVEQYPLTTEKGLTRSQDFSVQAAQQMLRAHWPAAEEITRTE
jgi:hypothetical protein